MHINAHGNVQTRFMSLQQAGEVFDVGWAKVRVGEHVRHPNGSLRSVTKKERLKIADLADLINGGK